MRSLSGRNEENPVEFRGFANGFGDEEMAVVDRVERPAENPETGQL